jgi:hypothetical protein
MKREQFRLGTVLRHYELQKQRTEIDLQRACRALHESTVEISRLDAEAAALAARLRSNAAAGADVWIASYRKSEQLGRELAVAHARRLREAAVVAHLQETHRKWSVAEEMLESIKREVDTFNHAEGDKAQQEFLEENVLRKWLSNSSESALDA